MFINVITEEQIRRDCPHNAPLTLRAFNKISPRQFNTSVSALNPYEIPRYAPKTVGQFAKALVSQQRGSTGQVTNALAVAEVQQAILAETEVEDFVMDVVEEKGGDGDEVFRKAAPGEMSMAEINEEIEIYELMLTNENLTGEEIDATLSTLKYYEKLRGEKMATLSDAQLGEELVRTRNAITPIIEEKLPVVEPTTRRKKSEMMEARAMGAEDTRTIERKEAKMRNKMLADVQKAGSAYSALMSTSAAKEMESRREATLRDEIANEMRDKERETIDESMKKDLMDLM